MYVYTHTYNSPGTSPGGQKLCVYTHINFRAILCNVISFMCIHIHIYLRIFYCRVRWICMYTHDCPDISRQRQETMCVYTYTQFTGRAEIMCIHIHINLRTFSCLLPLKFLPLKEPLNMDNLKKLEEQVEKTDLLQPSEYGKQKNTAARRRKLLQYLHRVHIIRMAGSGKVDEVREAMAIEELKVRIAAVPDPLVRNHENVCAACLDGHSFAWNAARQFYEKCSKILCQTIINILEEVIEQEKGISYIYTDEEMGRVFDTQEELKSLALSFAKTYCYLCTYDFCTKKFAEFWGFDEYSLLTPEHTRLAINFLPDRLKLVEGKYNFYHKDKPLKVTECMKDPQILYREDILEPLFQKAYALYDSPEDAFYDFANMTRYINILYQRQLHE